MSSRDEIKLAWAQGKPVQYRQLMEDDTWGDWTDWAFDDRLNLGVGDDWRAKPEPTRARMYLIDGGPVQVALWLSGTPEPHLSLHEDAKWIGPWQEVPE